MCILSTLYLLVSRVGYVNNVISGFKRSLILLGPPVLVQFFRTKYFSHSSSTVVQRPEWFVRLGRFQSIMIGWGGSRNSTSSTSHDSGKPVTDRVLSSIRLLGPPSEPAAAVRYGFGGSDGGVVVVMVCFSVCWLLLVCCLLW